MNTDREQIDIDTLDRRLIQVKPSQRQIALQQMEVYAFVHFTITTFIDQEWGKGTEDEAIFNPKKLDADQWVSAIKAAGMNGLILTCKHHDGFCLWPSKYTKHSVASSSYKGGKGDVVKEVADACRRGNIRFGVYLSPWDRNNENYGKGKAYDDYFVNQLTELLTNYGEICSVWFDGACGEGTNGKKQVYDWERYYALIRRLQPGACIHVCGPDIRWCGNESGHTRPAEWSVVPKRTGEVDRIADRSQKMDDPKFREKVLEFGELDLGSRKMLSNEKELIWYPAEVNVSIRPGWFYHEEDDEKIRPLEDLLRIYFNSAGGNATFLLNIPPNKEGLFHENDVKRLKEMGDYLKKAFAVNLLEQAELSADSWEEGHSIRNVREDNYDMYYKTADGVRTAEIVITFPNFQKVKYLIMKENIQLSQRIEHFEVMDQDGKLLYENTVVGYKRIAVLPEATVKELHIKITDSRVCPTLSFIGVY